MTTPTTVAADTEDSAADASSESDILLQLDDVHVHNRITDVEVVHGVSFTLRRGHVVGIVGESGSGKTLTCRAVLGILPALFDVSQGSIRAFDRDVLSLSESEWTQLRGTSITAVFQDPGSYLNPSLRIGKQIDELLRVKKKLSRREAKARTIELLTDVRLRDPELVYFQYPHELSGGMLQRVLIAAAISLEPQILIADEVTTALDVTIQAEILDLLIDLKERNGLSLIVVSHDLAVVAQVCDEVLVLKNGRVVEHGATEEVLYAPQDPYTKFLIGEHSLYGLERFIEDENTPLISTDDIDAELDAVLRELPEAEQAEGEGHER